MNPQTAWCEGCFRTLDEIVQWATADDAYKQRVWAQLDQRKLSTYPRVAASPLDFPQCEIKAPGSP
ncbi:MAG: DUF1289 domain-containing protein [Betaproteobacteria bacterium]|nr:DUF1289 domain-containing protein [Betaproteobacteria bacterium]